MFLKTTVVVLDPSPTSNPNACNWRPTPNGYDALAALSDNWMLSDVTADWSLRLDRTTPAKRRSKSITTSMAASTSAWPASVKIVARYLRYGFSTSAHNGSWKYSRPNGDPGCSALKMLRVTSASSGQIDNFTNRFTPVALEMAAPRKIASTVELALRIALRWASMGAKPKVSIVSVFIHES
ncbi:hypothetical protein H257_19362 [Aphanomyces astaci]|uniref:Uncharacterized protein n=1 Tax=Aphanomyces astaci TaxID=112090 RepID=W4F8C4_APHAT|nr:hypothetical protein H257_19362 [Aphanomyces astaci]ETV63707.1 hypothetical protein H257_19362 [Aphanomyces astaci]|eukprot:XP_009846810.1 hypothetical protein H257_19362 [Aphanomyces astaci]